MGYYINHNSKGDFIGTTFEEKINSLIEDGATKIPTPTKFTDNLVCVVDNGMFAAAAYAYSEQEMKVFLEGMNGRRFQWLSFDKAKELAK
jgi:hypothetical protein